MCQVGNNILMSWSLSSIWRRTWWGCECRCIMIACMLLCVVTAFAIWIFGVKQLVFIKNSQYKPWDEWNQHLGTSDSQWKTHWFFGSMAVGFLELCQLSCCAMAVAIPQCSVSGLCTASCFPLSTSCRLITAEVLVWGEPLLHVS